MKRAAEDDAEALRHIAGRAVVGGVGKGDENAVAGTQGNAHRVLDLSEGDFDLRMESDFRKRKPKVVEADRQISAGESADVLLTGYEAAFGDLVGAQKMVRLVGGLKGRDEKNQRCAKGEC